MTLARRLFNNKGPWPLKKANSYLTKYLMLVKDQREEIKSDLKQDKFLKPFQKQAIFKAAFYFSAQMNAQQRAPRTLFVPFFIIPNTSGKTWLSLEAILEECVAEVIDKEEPSMTCIGWGGDIFPFVFRLLKHGPTVEVSMRT